MERADFVKTVDEFLDNRGHTEEAYAEAIEAVETYDSTGELVLQSVAKVLPLKRSAVNRGRRNS